MTGTTIQSLHDDLDTIIQMSLSGDKEKANELLTLFNGRLTREVNDSPEQ
ncbi:TPA: hypothetical protein ACMDND_003118 [Vibrio metschnikovii]